MCARLLQELTFRCPAERESPGQKGEDDVSPPCDVAKSAGEEDDDDDKQGSGTTQDEAEYVDNLMYKDDVYDDDDADVATEEEDVATEEGDQTHADDEEERGKETLSSDTSGRLSSTSVVFVVITFTFVANEYIRR